MVLDLTLVGVSAFAFAVGAWMAFRLAHGAPARERRIWLFIASMMLVAAVVRGIMAARALAGFWVEVPLGLQLTLITNPAIASLVFAFVAPILRTYRVAEARRHAAEAAFRRSLDESRDAAAILDSDRTVAYVNAAALRMLQLPAEKVLGLPGASFIAMPEGAEAEPLAIESPAVQVEQQVRRADGSLVPVEAEIVGLGDGRVLAIARDVTPRREAEANRMRAERVTATQALASSVGTDLRDALSFVQSSVELTAELGTERVPLAPAISATAAAINVLDAFLDASSAPSAAHLGTGPVDLRLVVTEAVSAASARLEERTVIEWVPPSVPVPARVAEPDLLAVIGMLLENADAAIRESVSVLPTGSFLGRIVVRLERVSADGAPGSEVRLVVEDNGGVLPPELRAHMFEPLGESLSRVSRQLGLGSAHARVLRLGGFMHVSRRSMGGTTVTVRLPG